LPVHRSPHPRHSRKSFHRVNGKIIKPETKYFNDFMIPSAGVYCCFIVLSQRHIVLTIEVKITYTILKIGPLQLKRTKFPELFIEILIL
jgi:hypothetical protein